MLSFNVSLQPEKNGDALTFMLHGDTHVQEQVRGAQVLAKEMQDPCQKVNGRVSVQIVVTLNCNENPNVSISSKPSCKPQMLMSPLNADINPTDPEVILRALILSQTLMQTPKR